MGSERSSPVDARRPSRGAGSSPGAPCITGTVFAQVLRDVERLLAAGQVSKDGLSRWLRPEELRALADRPLPSGWYAIGTYARLNALLRDVAGGGRDAYLRELGGRSARQFLESGHYQQVAYARRTEIARATTREERFRAFGYDLRLFVSLSASFLNFSRWAARQDPEHAQRYLIEVTEAGHLPDELCWRAEGFVNELAAEHGCPGLWRWERVQAEVVHFRMVRDL